MYNTRCPCCTLNTQPRYYGGIKLGAGGLTRAYGQAARDCLRAAPRTTLVTEQVLTMQVPFDQLGAVHAVLNRGQVLHREEQYSQGGACRCVCRVSFMCSTQRM